jgi:hypothetical protein
MNEIIYIVIGRTTGSPGEVWGVAAYGDEEAARAHSEQAAAQTKRIQNNIRRAQKIRGKPFPEEKLQNFRAGNRYDPEMRVFGAVSYEVLLVPLAAGSGLQRSEG